MKIIISDIRSGYSSLVSACYVRGWQTGNTITIPPGYTVLFNGKDLWNIRKD